MSIQRTNATTISQSIEGNQVTALIGPRRVGKSYFLKQYAEAHPDRSWIFLNLDEMATKQTIEHGQLERLITETAQQTIGGGSKLWVVIDEAQKAPALFDQVKAIYDTYIHQDQIKIILTGSAVLGLHQLTAESLAGRIELHTIEAFTLREAAQFNAPKIPRIPLFESLISYDFDVLTTHIDQLKPFKPLLLSALDAQLIWGGLPEVVEAENDHARMTYLNNYLQTYLEKDVRALETITDLELYRNLLQICAEQTGSMRDIQRLCQALGSKADTVKKYQGYLEATLLFTQLYPYMTSSLGRLVKSPKAYVLNNGLISMLTGLLELGQLRVTGQIGHRFENWFFTELRTWLARSPMPGNIHYLRTSGGAEIDFIVRQGQLLLPIETTLKAHINPHKLRALKRFLANEPKAQYGLVVYSGEFKVDQTDRIIYLPAWCMA